LAIGLGIAANLTLINHLHTIGKNRRLGTNFLHDIMPFFREETEEERLGRELENAIRNLINGGDVVYDQIQNSWNHQIQAFQAAALQAEEERQRAARVNAYVPPIMRADAPPRVREVPPVVRMRAAAPPRVIEVAPFRPLLNNQNQAVHPRHKAIIDAKKIRIKTEMDMLLSKMDAPAMELGKHHAKAVIAANQLKKDLEDEFSKIAPDNCTYANLDQFFRNVASHIDKSRPTLEKDIAWGDYILTLLNTMLKKISVIFFGDKPSNFFKPAVAKYALEVEELSKSLNTIQKA
jgi:hypothetical protein